VRLHYLRDDPSRIGVIDDADLIELYRHPRAPDGRPWLRTNFVATLDGSISGPDGRSGTINTPSDHRIFALHRAHADVILVGAETARKERYRAVDLADWQRKIRTEGGLAPFPWLAIVTQSLALDPDMASPPYAHGPMMIITSGRSEPDLQPFRAAGIEIQQTGGGSAGQVDLREAVRLLTERGLGRVLCEGGPRLHRDLLAAELVDELSLTLAPRVVGGVGQRSTSGAALPRVYDFQLRHLLSADDQAVFTSYRRPAAVIAHGPRSR
jgi:riboflavin biosynthesis pyrimidine reductase